MAIKSSALPDFSEMSMAELQELVDAAQAALNEKKDARRQELLAELEALGGVPQATHRTRPVSESDDTRTRATPAPKYRSKRDAAVTWTGRGATPRWMREEMDAMNISTKDEFLIK
ncbi:H-NS family nucleoid-associated regulatory protein [Ancylobacter sp.]|uniref:H-NS histone family protein n=1 Tax=Ancylobacter sp. TaxID=1872567 RepID=UPI003C7BB75E